MAYSGSRIFYVANYMLYRVKAVLWVEQSKNNYTRESYILMALFIIQALKFFKCCIKTSYDAVIWIAHCVTFDRV